MAAKIKLGVELEAKGIKSTTKKVKKLNTELKTTKSIMGQTGVAANKTKRKLEGVGKTSLSAGKAFSRQAQGMGGLVAAYATIAANVFALSSAFLLLRRAADLSSMQKSAQNFSDRFGVNVDNITKRMQEASGGALDFAEALPAINKAVSAGVGIEQMEQLTVAATKAAQTFGGSTTEALNRFISASQRGRVEIIQTLGVVIKTEQAYREYAATIGKTALELSAFDRQQAILNATIAASEKVFAGITIDPNPFTQFGSTMIDVKNDILTFITDGVTPFLESFNRSKNAALALIAVMGAIVAKKIFPQLTEALKSFTAASIKSNVAATAAAKRAQKLRAETAKEFSKTSGRQTEKSLRKQLMAEEKSYAKRLTKHKSFAKSIFNADGSLDAARLNQQKAALIRQEKILAQGGTKGLQKNISKDINVVRKQIDARVRLIAVTGKLNNSEKALAATLDRTSKGFSKARAAAASFGATTKAVAIGLKSGIVTGFSKSFATMQSSVFLGFKKMRLAWASFGKSINKDGVNSLKRFSEAFGRTAGVVVGGLSRMIGLATSLFVAWSLYQLFWETFGDRIKGISKEQRELLNSFDDLGESFKEATKTSKKYLANMQGGVLTLSTFIAEAEFLRGTFDTLTVAVNDFNTAIFNATGTRSLEDISEYFTRAEASLKSLESELGKGILNETAVKFLGSYLTDTGTQVLRGFKEPTKDLQEYAMAAKNLGINMKVFQVSLKEANEQSLDNVARSLGTMMQLLDATGFEKLGKTLKSEVIKNLKQITVVGEDLATVFEFGTINEFIAVVQQLDDQGKAAAATKAIGLAFQSISREGKSVTGNFVASGRALEEINRNMSTYLSGLEKAKAASVPNKAIFNILLSSERALKDLINSTGDDKSTKKKLEDLIGAPDLKQLRAFFDIADDAAFSEALKTIQDELIIYNAIIDDSINNASRFKTIANELFSVKNEEASTDARRLEVAELLNVLAIKKLQLEKDTTDHKLAAAISERQMLIDNSKDEALKLTIGEHAIANAVALVEELKAESEGHQLSIDIIKAKLDVERLRNKIISETLTMQTGVNKAELSIAKSQKKLSGNMKTDLALRHRIFALDEQSIDIQIAINRQAVVALDVNKETYEQDLKRNLVLDAELLLLEQKTVELERQRLLLDASDAEAGGITIFNKEGISLAADFFIREVRDKARDLKTTFQILGQGFVKNINDSFDQMVTDLLEGVWGKGGRDFGRAVLETLKAGLRETFGEALKTKIKEAFAGIFSSGPSPAEIAATQRHEALILTTARQISSEDLNTAALDRLNATMGGKSSGTTSTGPNTAQAATVEAVEKLSDTVASDLGASLKELVTIDLETMEVTKTGFLENLKILGLQLIELVKAGAKAIASGVGSLFGFAKGGMIAGGMQLPKLATGAITRGPAVAMIGEGRNEEAVVPLPNNREIPVDLKGGGDTFNIEQNYDFSNADVNAIPRLRQEAKAIQARAVDEVFSLMNKGGKYAKMGGRR